MAVKIFNSLNFSLQLSLYSFEAIQDFLWLLKHQNSLEVSRCSTLLRWQCHSVSEIQRERDIQWLQYLLIVLLCLILFSSYKLMLSLLQRESIFCFHETFSIIMIALRFPHQVASVYCAFPLSYSANNTSQLDNHCSSRSYCFYKPMLVLVLCNE